ncbi:MAG: hypothetical protein R3E39_08430 [Anaerolineae bacterium]
MIACILIPDIISACSPEAKPLILVSNKGIVRAASLSLAHKGVRVGMRTQAAHALCPEATVMPFDDQPYRELVETVADSLLIFSSKVELPVGFWRPQRKPLLSIHPSGAIFYVDLGKLRKTEAAQLVHEMSALLLATFHVPCCVGLASNKFTASVAVRLAQPNNPKLVQRGFEGRFLARHSINLLPLDKEINRRLHQLGISTIGQFATLPADAVFNQFGKQGRFLHMLATGEDTCPVSTRIPKAKEHLTRVFDGAIEDKQVLQSALEGMGCELAKRLAEKNLTTQLLELTFATDDKHTLKTKRVLHEPTAHGKLLGRTLLRLLEQLKCEAGVTEVRVMADNLATPVMRQLDLFGTATLNDNRLSDLLEKLTMRFGNESLYSVVTAEPDHWLPEYRYVIEPIEEEVA